MPKIFISYRRDETAGYAGRIHERLAAVFGTDSVFMDFDDLQPGVEFAPAIEKAVGSSDVLLVLIGKQWLNFKNADGQRRLESPQDFVRLEIASALAQKVRVIPVLLNNAAMPSEQDLPDPLKRLVQYQALEITDERWNYDLNRLVTTLGRGKRQWRTAVALGLVGLAILLLALYLKQPAIDVSGNWSALVPYEFGNPMPETFALEQERQTINGTASFFKVARTIVDGKVEEGQITFSTKTEEVAGSESRQATHHYRGVLEGNQIRFVMQTAGGFSTHPPIRFSAQRDVAEK